MRVSYRTRSTKDYWESRWTDIQPDRAMDNRDAYPLKYAELTVKDKEGAILEAGCGAGRILRYFHDKGHKCIGIDYIKIAIDKLKNEDNSLQVEVADITSLRFPNDTFRYVLAFGLYHNLENGLQQAINETSRVLENDGLVCASFRADNIQNRLIDAWTKFRNRKSKEVKYFHKLNLTRTEFEKLFIDAGFTIEKLFPVENMPLLYKFSFFRSSKQKEFNENMGRAEGYQLSGSGQIVQNILMRLFPDQFCNIYVLIARK